MSFDNKQAEVRLQNWLSASVQQRQFEQKRQTMLAKLEEQAKPLQDGMPSDSETQARLQTILSKAEEDTAALLTKTLEKVDHRKKELVALFGESLYLPATASSHIQLQHKIASTEQCIEFLQQHLAEQQPAMQALLQEQQQALASLQQQQKQQSPQASDVIAEDDIDSLFAQITADLAELQQPVAERSLLEKEQAHESEHTANTGPDGGGQKEETVFAVASKNALPHAVALQAWNSQQEPLQQLQTEQQQVAKKLVIAQRALATAQQRQQAEPAVSEPSLSKQSKKNVSRTKGGIRDGKKEKQQNSSLLGAEQQTNNPLFDREQIAKEDEEEKVKQQQLLAEIQQLQQQVSTLEQEIAEQQRPVEAARQHFEQTLENIELEPQQSAIETELAREKAIEEFCRGCLQGSLSQQVQDFLQARHHIAEMKISQLTVAHSAMDEDNRVPVETLVTAVQDALYWQLQNDIAEQNKQMNEVDKQLDAIAKTMAAITVSDDSEEKKQGKLFVQETLKEEAQKRKEQLTKDKDSLSVGLQALSPPSADNQNLQQAVQKRDALLQYCVLPTDDISGEDYDKQRVQHLGRVWEGLAAKNHLTEEQVKNLHPLARPYAELIDKKHALVRFEEKHSKVLRSISEQQAIEQPLSDEQQKTFSAWQQQQQALTEAKQRFEQQLAWLADSEVTEPSERKLYQANTVLQLNTRLSSYVKDREKAAEYHQQLVAELLPAAEALQQLCHEMAADLAKCQGEADESLVHLALGMLNSPLLEEAGKQQLEQQGVKRDYAKDQSTAANGAKALAFDARCRQQGLKSVLKAFIAAEKEKGKEEAAIQLVKLLAQYDVPAKAADSSQQTVSDELLAELGLTETEQQAIKERRGHLSLPEKQPPAEMKSDKKVPLRIAKQYQALLLQTLEDFAKEDYIVGKNSAGREHHNALSQYARVLNNIAAEVQNNLLQPLQQSKTSLALQQSKSLYRDYLSAIEITLQHCDLGTAQAIFSALESSEVAALGFANDESIQARLQTIRTTLAPQQSYKGQREIMKEDGAIPYIGVLQTDATFVEDGNKNYGLAKHSGQKSPIAKKIALQGAGVATMLTVVKQASEAPSLQSEKTYALAEQQSMAEQEKDARIKKVKQQVKEVNANQQPLQHKIKKSYFQQKPVRDNIKKAAAKVEISEEQFSEALTVLTKELGQKYNFSQQECQQLAAYHLLKICGLQQHNWVIKDENYGNLAKGEGFVQKNVQNVVDEERLALKQDVYSYVIEHFLPENALLAVADYTDVSNRKSLKTAIKDHEFPIDDEVPIKGQAAARLAHLIGEERKNLLPVVIEYYFRQYSGGAEQSVYRDNFALRESGFARQQEKNTADIMKKFTAAEKEWIESAVCYEMAENFAAHRNNTDLQLQQLQAQITALQDKAAAADRLAVAWDCQFKITELCQQALEQSPLPAEVKQFLQEQQQQAAQKLNALDEVEAAANEQGEIADEQVLAAYHLPIALQLWPELQSLKEKIRTQQIELNSKEAALDVSEENKAAKEDPVQTEILSLMKQFKEKSKLFEDCLRSSEANKQIIANVEANPQQLTEQLQQAQYKQQAFLQFAVQPLPDETEQQCQQRRIAKQQRLWREMASKPQLSATELQEWHPLAPLYLQLIEAKKAVAACTGAEKEQAETLEKSVAQQFAQRLEALAPPAQQAKQPHWRYDLVADLQRRFAATFSAEQHKQAAVIIEEQLPAKQALHHLFNTITAKLVADSTINPPSEEMQHVLLGLFAAETLVEAGKSSAEAQAAKALLEKSTDGSAVATEENGQKARQYDAICRQQGLLAALQGFVQQHQQGEKGPLTAEALRFMQLLAKSDSSGNTLTKDILERLSLQEQDRQSIAEVMDASHVAAEQTGEPLRSDDPIALQIAQQFQAQMLTALQGFQIEDAYVGQWSAEQKNSGRHHHNALSKMTQTLNSIATTVSSDILAAGKEGANPVIAKQQAKEKYSHYLAAVESCLASNDVGTAMAIFSGLKAVPIFRLCLHEEPDMAKRYQQIESILQSESNFSHMRQKMANDNSLAFFGVLQQDITFTHDSFKAYDSTAASNDSPLAKKMRKEGALLLQLQTFVKRAQHTKTAVAEVSYQQAVKPLLDTELDAKSRVIQARGGEGNETVAKQRKIATCYYADKNVRNSIAQQVQGQVDTKEQFERLLQTLTTELSDRYQGDESECRSYVAHYLCEVFPQFSAHVSADNYLLRNAKRYSDSDFTAMKSDIYQYLQQQYLQQDPVRGFLVYGDSSNQQALQQAVSAVGENFTIDALAVQQQLQEWGFTAQESEIADLLADFAAECSADTLHLTAEEPEEKSLLKAAVYYVVGQQWARQQVKQQLSSAYNVDLPPPATQPVAQPAPESEMAATQSAGQEVSWSLLAAAADLLSRVSETAKQLMSSLRDSVAFEVKNK